MKSMKMSKKETDYMSQPQEVERPEYPYGLRISLGKDELSKLGIDKLPGLKTEMKVEAKVEVTSVSESESIYGEHKSMELQITHMELTESGE